MVAGMKMWVGVGVGACQDVVRARAKALGIVGVETMAGHEFGITASPDLYWWRSLNP